MPARTTRAAASFTLSPGFEFRRSSSRRYVIREILARAITSAPNKASPPYKSILYPSRIFRRALLLIRGISLGELSDRYRNVFHVCYFLRWWSFVRSLWSPLRPLFFAELRLHKRAFLASFIFMYRQTWNTSDKFLSTHALCS